MRATGLCLLLLTTTTLIARAEGFVDNSFEPQSAFASQFVQQLSAEDFQVRATAFAQLEKLGPRALVALQAQRDSLDTEVRTSVNKLLPMAEDQASSVSAYRLWKARVETSWPEALRNGKLCGPLLGVDTFDPQPKVRYAQDADFMQVKRGVHEPDLQKVAAWLAERQEADGHWISRKSGSEVNADVEETALCLLALMDVGNSEKNGKQQEAVAKAVHWLTQHQQFDGAILGAGWKEVDGVAHALAAVALSHAAAYSQLPATLDAAQKAADYSFKVHQTRDGQRASGFGRMARSKTPDLFTTLLFTMQLKAANLAGLNTPAETGTGIASFLDAIKPTSDAAQEKGGHPGLYGWVPGGKPNTDATLMALLARQQLGYKTEDLAGTTKLAFERFGTPRLDREYSDVLLNYCGMALKLSQSREDWIAWFRPLRQHYQENLYYDLSGNEYWLPNGVWDGVGSVTNSALCSLALAVYAR